MKKFAALAVLVALTAQLVACGEPEIEVAKKDDVFPISGKIVRLLKGTSVQAQIKSGDSVTTIEIEQDARVHYNGKQTTVNALAQGQTVYAESSDGARADAIAITDWPGMISMGQPVAMSQEAAFGSVIGYILENHEGSGIPGKGMWKQAGKPAKIGKDQMMVTYESGKYRLRITWMAQIKDADYDATVYRSDSEMSIWSGRIRKDGKIVEDRYDEK